MPGSITDVPGILVGHYTDRRAATGCTVVLCEAGAVPGVAVRGAAPGTRETDCLRPGMLVPKLHAVLLSGGSAFGLAAAEGVMAFLEARGVGFRVRNFVVPVVPAAILFDLSLGDGSVRPGAAEGRRACEAATAGRVAEGSVGAGTGATVAKALGMEHALKGGVGSASERFGDGVVVGALAAVNALGDIIDPATGQQVAGPRNPAGPGFLRTLDILKSGRGPQRTSEVGENTTLAVVATNAALTKEQATKVAQMAHDGLARTIWPVHTMADGDVVFVLSAGERQADLSTLGAVAAEVTAQAILRGVKRARGLCGVPGLGDSK
ncbi:MAG: peptidase S58 family protein [Dehalococcoidia bacterium]|nr:peptidase S58 family protein [Dehalococcoidia bacterium]